MAYPPKVYQAQLNWLILQFQSYNLFLADDYII